MKRAQGVCVCVCVYGGGRGMWFGLSQVVKVPLRVWLGGRKIGLGEVGAKRGKQKPLWSGAPKAVFTLRRPICAPDTHSERGRVSEREGLTEGRGSRKITFPGLDFDICKTA